jgi:CubicO group peptidase (beta-lactamase class C family)
MRSPWWTALLAASFALGCGADPKPAPHPHPPGHEPAIDAPPPTGAAILTWTPEQQLYGYRNMEKLGPAAVVAHGEHVRALPDGTPLPEPAIADGGGTVTLDQFMATYRVSGVLVLRAGQIVLERYALGRTADERWTSFSVAKSITSTLVGAAVHDGFIKSLDDDVTTYLPELAGSAYDGASVRDLITMRSGVAWNEDYTDPDADVTKVGLLPPVGGENPVVTYMKALPRAAAPGTRFSYNTGETDLTGVLVSRAVGKPLAAYLAEKIWRPFGMEADAVWNLDSGGHERGGCCMSMTLRDYARFGLFMLEGGQAGGAQVLPAGWGAEATRAHVAMPGYGYFWWIPGDGSYYAAGIFGQSITVVPDEQLVIAVNSAWPAPWTPALAGTRGALVDGIRAAARAATP